jgi:hypothetical protein
VGVTGQRRMLTPTSCVSRGPCKFDFFDYGLFHVPDMGTYFDCRFPFLPVWTN